MPLIPYTEAPEELLTLFHAEKESILARYYEPEPGLFIAESAKVTLRAVQAGYELTAMLIEDAQLGREAQELLSRFPAVPAYHAPSDEYLRISGYPMTRGVLALFRRKESCRPEPLHFIPGSFYSGLEKARKASAGFPAGILSALTSGFGLFSGRSFKADSTASESASASASASRRRTAVLVEVGNPANIGSIFRNAAALGISSIMLSKGCCDPLSRRCLRVSMGCVFQVPWMMTGLPGEKIADLLKTQGFRTAAMALSDDSVSILDPSLKKDPRLAIFLGNEGNGLPEETIDACDVVVRIPMKEGVDSLNVAAASAVAFWELR